MNPKQRMKRKLANSTFEKNLAESALCRLSNDHIELVESGYEYYFRIKNSNIEVKSIVSETELAFWKQWFPLVEE